jgi:hypothetical protein
LAVEEMIEIGKRKRGKALYEWNPIIAGISDGNGGIRFDHTPEELLQIAEDNLVYEHRVLSEIMALPQAERNFLTVAHRNAMRESNAAAVRLVLEFYASVAPDKEMRDAANEIYAKNTAYDSEML